ncbi:MAG TPA: DUF6569 family protein [Methylomirabilota bacterium]|nr:DUF6569 family protein [Methylomirabilota bacterium]
MRTRRREFLRICGLAMAGAVASPAVAGATRVRILDPAADGDRPILAGQVSLDFQRFMAGIRVGPAKAHAGLLVFGLVAKEMPAALEVSTLDEARAKGSLIITEREQAAVPELLVDNRGKTAVLMLAGEILVGGKQNRVLKEDVLLPPLSGPRNLAVYCVERGRWNEGRKEFESKSSFAQPGIRAHLMRKAPQSQVWSAVSQATRAAEAQSPTDSYQQIYEKPEVKSHLADAERGLDAAAAPGAFGAAVFTGGGLSGLDLFHAPTLFAREWPKLLRAHAVEAYRQPRPTEWPEAKLRARVEALLGGAARTEGTLHGNAGVGQLFEFRLDQAQGAALLYEGRAIHTAIL